MNVLLWVLQIALALLFVAGGAYKVFNPGDVAKRAVALPPGGWRAVGVIEMLGGILLVIPAGVTGRPDLIPLAAGVLALESLFLSAIYARTSVKLVAANPLVYSVPMALLAAVVAVARHALA